MNNIFDNIFYLYKWLPARRKIQFFFILTFSILVSATEMVTIGSIVPFVSSVIGADTVLGNSSIIYIEEIFKIEKEEEVIMILGLIFVVLAVITGFFRSLLVYIISRYSNVLLAEIATTIYEKKLNEPYLKFITKSSDHLLGLISSKLFQIYAIITGILFLLTSTILLISIVAILLFIDLKLTLISMTVFGLLYFIVILGFRKTLLNNSRIISENQTLMVKRMQEGVGSIRDIILDGNQKVYTNLFSKLIFERGFKVAINDMIAQSPRFLLETVGIILISIFLFFSSKQGGVLSLFPVLSALALGAQKIMPLMNIIYTNYTTTVSNSHQLHEAVISLNDEVTDYQRIIDNQKIFFNEKITLKNIFFSYSEFLPTVLKNINFDIIKGSKIGIIGKTGEGKSTLLDIIMGLLEPVSGEIFVDKKLISNENLNTWRKKITHVPQDIFLINGSILENIAFGIEKDEVDMVKIIECAKKSKIFDFIENLPKKFNELVGERGIKLSGGQKQRLGIARALYRKSELIVLDEATNALDLKTEKEIVDSIGELDNITIIMVAHRLDTLKICDKVYKIEKKSIKETQI